MPTHPYLTIQEFQACSRLGRTKIYELLASGELKAIKVGRRTLISGAAAQAWFDAQPLYRPTVGVKQDVA